VGEHSRIDDVVKRIKRHPVVALALILSTIVVGLSSFTNAARNLLGLLPDEATADVSGRWSTEELDNQYDKSKRYRLIFDLKARDGLLLGTLQIVQANNQGAHTKALREGHIEGHEIEFHTLERSVSGQEEIQFKDFYSGTVDGLEIRFVRDSDRPWEFMPQEFVAKRE